MKLKGFYRYYLIAFFCSISTWASATTAILALSDIHFDPFYGCHSRITCSLIKELKEAPVTKWEELLSKAVGDNAPASYGSDTNYALLNMSLNSIKKIARKEHIKTAILTGDLLGHEYKHKYLFYFLTQKGYSEFVRKTIDYIFLKLKIALPNTTLYYALGNNDSDKGDYIAEPNSEFYRTLTKTLNPLLPNKEKKTFTKQFQYGGFYTANLSPKLSLIVLNSTFFSLNRKGQDVEEGAAQQYKWLKKTLSDFKQHHQHALIAMHIPLAINVYASLGKNSEYFFTPAYHKQLLTLLNHYNDTLIGVITGHVHADTFFLFGNQSLQLMQSGIPSISPIFGTNPSFKIYQLKTDIPALKDYETYYLNAPIKTGHFEKGYDFNQTYQPKCPNCILFKGMRALPYDTPLADFFRQQYHSNSKDYVIKQKNWRAYWCGIHTSSIEAFTACRKSNNRAFLSTRSYEQHAHLKPEVHDDSPLAHP